MEDYKHDGKPVYRFLQSNYRENLDCRREHKTIYYVVLSS